MAENEKDKASHVVNSQAGIIGDNAKVSGGIHFHNYHSIEVTGAGSSNKSDELSAGPDLTGGPKPLFTAKKPGSWLTGTHTFS
jgi:hypothetical protein